MKTQITLQVEAKKNLSISSNCEVIGSFIGIDMVGFCFGIGFILAVNTVNNLEYCIEELISRKYYKNESVKQRVC